MTITTKSYYECDEINISNTDNKSQNMSYFIISEQDLNFKHRFF